LSSRSARAPFQVSKPSSLQQHNYGFPYCSRFFRFRLMASRILSAPFSTRTLATSRPNSSAASRFGISRTRVACTTSFPSTDTTIARIRSCSSGPGTEPDLEVGRAAWESGSNDGASAPGNRGTGAAVADEAEDTHEVSTPIGTLQPPSSALNKLL